MTNEEFQAAFQVIQDSYIYYDDNKTCIPWPHHIAKNLYLLPIEHIELISCGLPSSSGWSRSVVKGAQTYIIENMLLMPE